MIENFCLQVVGLIWGFIIQQFSETVYVLGAGFILAAIVSIIFLAFLLLHTMTLF